MRPSRRRLAASQNRQPLTNRSRLPSTSPRPRGKNRRAASGTAGVAMASAPSC
jgi:hypothetical protein